MADLVAEMAEQRAVRLVQLVAAALALGVVGLGEVQRDDAVVVAGQHRLARRQAGLGLELELEAVLRDPAAA